MQRGRGGRRETGRAGRRRPRNEKPRPATSCTGATIGVRPGAGMVDGHLHRDGAHRHPGRLAVAGLADLGRGCDEDLVAPLPQDDGFEHRHRPGAAEGEGVGAPGDQAGGVAGEPGLHHPARRPRSSAPPPSSRARAGVHVAIDDEHHARAIRMAGGEQVGDEDAVGRPAAPRRRRAAAPARTRNGVLAGDERRQLADHAWLRDRRIAPRARPPPARARGRGRPGTGR